jgi:hypothetical protein
MRSLLIITATLLAISVKLSAQSDFISLDKRTYDYYLKGDRGNLMRTSDTLFSLGIDYYYLRMRLGILAYNEQKYSEASRNFYRALELNSLDTISSEYIYNCYVFSGRNPDANIYLEILGKDKKNIKLQSEAKPGFSDFFISSSLEGYDVILYETNNHYYEAVNRSFSLNAQLETYFSGRIKGIFGYSNFRKDGTVYDVSFPTGTDLAFNQNQLYARLSGYAFRGWEFSGFGHGAFYSDATTRNQTVREYLLGAGISKNGWKLRGGANFSFSNFSLSNQIRGEGFLTWLPYGNLNLYITSGWMGQNDMNWGGTYQLNAEIGFKVMKSLWMETGTIFGNSFLYARDMGYILNNSFLIPATTIYSNIIIMAGNHIRITLSPYYSENLNYTWNLKTYTRSGKLITDSFGGMIKLTFKNRQ